MELSQIIEGCRKGKSRAQEQLFNLYADEMFAVCLYYSPNRTEAEDTLHEGFLKVFQNIESLKGEGALKGWIRRILINTALEKYRKKSPMYILDDEDYSEVKDSMNEDAISNISADDLISLIQELSPQYRMVFNLYALEGFSHKEIAEKLNISEGTSKSNLARARSILQKKVKAYFYLSPSKING
ncbi:MAG: sigma-70 family RNA polymerase sigma factor [Bacteroidales bacterium]|nr:sigma-70 family RNA polymerase sigma factor [Bacteroidales bacterium]